MERRTIISLVITALILFSLGAFSCGDDDDDESSSVGDDDDTIDDDDDDNDDDDSLPNASVDVKEAPQGNPLGRKLVVTTDSPCSLSGRVTTDGEPGYGPSSPVESANGATHEFWFYGLLKETEFEYTFFIAGSPEQVVATGTFTTPSLPENAPELTELEFDNDQTDRDWFAIWSKGKGLPGADDDSISMLYDREGRVRLFHQNEIKLDAWTTPIVNGELIYGTEDSLRGISLNGDEYLVYDIDANDPYFILTHHQFYLVNNDIEQAYVIFNQIGSGVECDLVTPSDSVVGDGILKLDSNGVETWRWSAFDHQDVIPPEAMDVENCLIPFWGFGKHDWTHGNSVWAFPDENALLVSFRNAKRILKIDIDTGDVIWQMGPELTEFEWLGDEDEEDKWFRFQHDAYFISDTRLLVFDNGNCRYGGTCLNGPWSRALELEVDQVNMTVEQVWEYRTPFALSQGNVERFENGNTLISSGSAIEVMVVTPLDEEIFYMKFTKGQIRARNYPSIWVYNVSGN